MAKTYHEESKKTFLGGKNSVLSVLVMTLVILLGGCASVSYGRADNWDSQPETPVEGRVLLELSSNVDHNWSPYLIGDEGNRNVVNLPAGHYELLLGYHRQTVIDSYTTSGGGYRTTTTTYEVASAGNIPLDYTFEAGHHYYINGVGGGDGVYIEVYDLGTDTDLFHNGVYTGGIQSFGLYIGSGANTFAMLGPEFGYAGVIDFGIPIKLGLNAGVDFGFGPGIEDNPTTYYDEGSMGIGMAFGGFAGLFGHFYIPNTSMSVGAGYGYRAEISVPYDGFYSPFIRGEFIWDGLGIFAEYYTNPAFMNVFEGRYGMRYADVFKRWGVGIFVRY